MLKTMLIKITPTPVIGQVVVIGPSAKTWKITEVVVNQYGTHWVVEEIKNDRDQP